jgi:HTH-type transcriptional regulator/antitoxin HigA
MDIKPIRSEADHRAALLEIERLWDAQPGTPDADRFEVLATLVDAYEREHTPILPPDPIEAIKFRLEQSGLTRKALETIIGTRARVSEIFSGRRALTLAMIRALNSELKIPLEALIRERKPRRRAASRKRRDTHRRKAQRTSV